VVRKTPVRGSEADPFHQETQELEPPDFDDEAFGGDSVATGTVPGNNSPGESRPAHRTLEPNLDDFSPAAVASESSSGDDEQTGSDDAKRRAAAQVDEAHRLAAEGRLIEAYYAAVSAAAEAKRTGLVVRPADDPKTLARQLHETLEIAGWGGNDPQSRPAFSDDAPPATDAELEFGSSAPRAHDQSPDAIAGSIADQHISQNDSRMMDMRDPFLDTHPVATLDNGSGGTADAGLAVSEPHTPQDSKLVDPRPKRFRRGELNEIGPEAAVAHLQNAPTSPVARVVANQASVITANLPAELSQWDLSNLEIGPAAGSTEAQTGGTILSHTSQQTSLVAPAEVEDEAAGGDFSTGDHDAVGPIDLSDSSEPAAESRSRSARFGVPATAGLIAIVAYLSGLVAWQRTKNRKSGAAATESQEPQAFSESGYIGGCVADHNL
jgi:hypothetical protein